MKATPPAAETPTQQLTAEAHFRAARKAGHKKWPALALKNTPELMRDEEYDTLADALFTSFSWKASPEGFLYWSNIHYKLV